MSFFDIGYLTNNVELVFVATLVFDFWSLSNILKVLFNILKRLSNMIGLCIVFLVFVSSFGALYCLSGLCKVFWGFTPPPRATLWVAPRRLPQALLHTALLQSSMHHRSCPIYEFVTCAYRRLLIYLLQVSRSRNFLEVSSGIETRPVSLPRFTRCAWTILCCPGV